MISYVIYSRGTKKQTILEIKRSGFFSTITGLKKNKLKLITKKPVSSKQIKKIEKIRNVLLKIKTVKADLTMYPMLDVQKKDSLVKFIHIFADVDSTLTHTGVSSINRSVKSLIEKFTEQNCVFYFCTGRSYQNVERLRIQYDTGEYAIAENGGIILGVLEHLSKRGDKKPIDKLIKYLRSNDICFTIDPNQKNRKTEYIFLKDSINENILKKAIRQSKANVEYHMSKNTYHISKKGINKGTAIEYLTGADELDLNPEINQVIAIGDSDLDYPMFVYADKGYLVGKPEKSLKVKISKLKKKIKILNPAPKALVELYEELFPYG